MRGPVNSPSCSTFESTKPPRRLPRRSASVKLRDGRLSSARRCLYTRIGETRLDRRVRRRTAHRGWRTSRPHTGRSFGRRGPTPSTRGKLVCKSPHDFALNAKGVDRSDQTLGSRPPDRPTDRQERRRNVGGDRRHHATAEACSRRSRERICGSTARSRLRPERHPDAGKYAGRRCPTLLKCCRDAEEGDANADNAVLKAIAAMERGRVAAYASRSQLFGLDIIDSSRSQSCHDISKTEWRDLILCLKRRRIGSYHHRRANSGSPVGVCVCVCVRLLADSRMT